MADAPLFGRLGALARRYPVAIAAVLMLIAAASLWIYSGVRGALFELAAANLRSLLTSQVAAVETWIGEKQLNVRRWANDPRVVALVVPLVTAAAVAGDRAAEQACRGPLRTRLVDIIDGLRLGEPVPAIVVVDRAGRLLATRDDALCGQTLGDAARRELAPVWGGTAQFKGPTPERERLGIGTPERGAKPLIWLYAPVLDMNGDVIAVLSVGKLAEDRFAHLFTAARVGESGEAYAFDDRGRLLSDTRFRADLVGAGRLNPGASPILQLRLSDPGNELGGDPLTRLAAQALSALAQRSPGTELLAGELVEPYRNYVGARVVGAWRWLDEFGLGVAVEIRESEALAPLLRLERAFTVLAIMVGAAVFGLIVALLRMRGLVAEVAAAQRVGNYELFEEIGQGGVARVYRARHRLLKRPTAVKIIELHRSTDELLARFDREVKLSSQLMHPNTIEIYDYGRTPEGRPFYAMELLDGLTLQQLVERHGPFGAARALRVMLGVAGSLSEAHERGLVHRDVKPGNVMLCRKGAEYDFPKLLDFGLIKDTRTPHTRDLTRALRVLGTPVYMAPERIEHPDSADARSDLYALGALGFFALTGRPPFEGETDLALAYKVVNSPVPSLRDIAASVPASLDGLIAWCLRKDPAQRPQTAVELIEQLDLLVVQYPWTNSDARAWWESHAGQTAPAAAADPTVQSPLEAARRTAA